MPYEIEDPKHNPISTTIDALSVNIKPGLHELDLTSAFTRGMEKFYKKYPDMRPPKHKWNFFVAEASTKIQEKCTVCSAVNIGTNMGDVCPGKD